MASLSKDKAGNRTIQFVATDGKRRSIRLGSMSAKHAEQFKQRVEILAACASSKLTIDGETAKWLGEIDDGWAAKLAAVGLMPERQSRTLGVFLNAYLDRRRADSKPATIANIHRVVFDLTEYFGAETGLRSITAEKAAEFKDTYLAKGLASATVYRQLKWAKMFFGLAVKGKLIPENPFADVKGKSYTPTERQYYLTIADTYRLLEAANPTWRTIIALCRFAGLRCPSEILSLKWDDVNLAEGRMVVTSPKTEHLEGKGNRIVPVFAVLRPYLEEAYELAVAGEEFVIGGKTGATFSTSGKGVAGWQRANLRTTFLKIIRRAGLVAWPKPFHNLRASCETDLVKEHPIHVVTAWIGNTPKVAIQHYLQTTEADFAKAVKGSAASGAKSGARAVQNPVHAGADVNGPEMTNAAETPVFVGSRRVLADAGELCQTPKYTRQELNRLL